MERRWACCIVVEKEQKRSFARAVWEEMITHDLISSSDFVRASLLASHEQSLLKSVDFVESY